MSEKIKTNQFVVALEGIDLKPAQVKAINAGIKSMVMKELASIDNLNELKISGKELEVLIGKRPGHIINGIIIRNEFKR